MLPPPLFKQLVLALLVGTGCFLFSILFYFCTGDCILLILGTVLFLGSISNGLSLYQLIKKKTYYCLEGICIYRQYTLKKYCQVQITDDTGEIYHLQLPKSSQIQTGLRYRLYFKNSFQGKEVSYPLYIKKTLQTEAFLGLELLENQH